MSAGDSFACFVQQIGTAVPEPSLGLEDTARLLEHACANARGAKLLGRIARLTGIERRHLAALSHQGEHLGERAVFQPAHMQPHGPGMGARTQLFEREAGPLVLRALSSFSPAALAEVQTLITVSCTHASSPGLEHPILMKTAVSEGVDRWNLGFMGCSGALAALRLVHHAAGRQCRALIVACELSSLHYQYTDQLDQMTANLLFGDGAAAVLVTPRPTGVRILDCRCVSLPACADQMLWFAGDHGLRLRLSQELPETLAGSLPGAVARFLRDHGHEPGDVSHWLVHPGGLQILDAVEKSLSLPRDALAHSRDVYRTHGNMSSPTILFILRRLLESGAQGLTLAMAFGPGLTIEFALLRLSARAGEAG